MSSSGLSFPSHVDTPLLRADVTRLESLDDPPPLEGRGPLRSKSNRPAEDTLHACLPLWVVQALREDIRELERRGDPYEQHIAVLDDLVREVLPDVNMLGPLTSSRANDVDAPLDARDVVLKHLDGVLLSEAESLEQVSEIQDVHACCRCRVVLCLCSREGNGLLHPGAPHDRRLVVQHQVPRCGPAG